MSRKLFQYGTAVHLALLTVAPLFLSAFADSAAHALILFWLSISALIWVVMNPSLRRDEWPRDARQRIGWELGHDPFMFFCIVALVLTAIRAANGGVSLDYNPSSGQWYLKEPFVPLLPGSVTGQGLLPLAGLFGLAVVTLGVRHALGYYARFCYLFSTGLFAAAAVSCWLFLPARGVSISGLVPAPADPFPLGSLLGVPFLFAIVAWVESWTQRAAILELVSAILSGILLAGLYAFAPTFSLYVFALAGLLAFTLGAAFALMWRHHSAWWRTALAFALAVVPVAFLVFDKYSRPALWPLFPDGFAALRDAATSVAIRAWRELPQMGAGLGSYSLMQGFYATPEDWQVLTEAQTAVPNGWIQFFFERGFLGAVVFLIGLGILLKDAILRYVRAGSDWTFAAVHFLGPLALVAVTAVLFVECSYARIGALMSVGAALALTTAALPESLEADHG